MRRHPKNHPIVLLTLGVFLLLPLFLILTYGFLLLPLEAGSTQKVEFKITPGQSLSSITSSLQSRQLIRSALGLKVYIILNRLNSKIQAGLFSLSPSDSAAVIAEKLTHASTEQARVTIQEGLRREEVANAILDALIASKLPHNFDADLFISKTKGLEGQLYPDTYNFQPEVTTDQVIEKMTNEFSNKIAQLNIKSDKLNQTIILASLIEREAGADSERAEIAGILLNRLNNNWPLQVDATVQYAISSARCRNRICIWWPRPLTKADIETISPYNTYRQIGLPPAPIGNPGFSSLSAAANPSLTENWFYLHDASGKIHYAATVEAHNTNVCTFLKKGC